jgi:hypothetical protein
MCLAGDCGLVIGLWICDLWSEDGERFEDVDDGLRYRLIMME